LQRKKPQQKAINAAAMIGTPAARKKNKEPFPIPSLSLFLHGSDPTDSPGIHMLKVALHPYLNSGGVGNRVGLSVASHEI
jgi:hypothetical protein